MFSAIYGELKFWGKTILNKYPMPNSISQQPEKSKYNWKEYLDKEVPTATIKNDILDLFGESFIKKEI